MTDPHLAPQWRAKELDLSLVSQRILKLAEISVLDHLEAIDRSQAVGIPHMVRDDPGTTGTRPGSRATA